MAKEKKPVHKVQMTEGKRNIIQMLLQEYDIESAQDIQDALKDLLGGTIKEMMEAEMDDHLGYSKSERSDSDDYRKTDAYSLAIRFAFYLPLRFSETAALKYSDIKKGTLRIQHAQRTCQEMNDDLTFEPRYLTNEERIKGNKKSGFRTVGLTSTALSIAEMAHKLYPNNEYLFMRDGQQIILNTFNEELEKICKKLNIKYRSSHQLRFTVATMLFQAGMPINKLSVLLGHSTVAMTWHYIRQQAPDAEDIALMEAVLD